MSSERVVVALSGGVDSTVAALLMQRAGMKVTGVNLRMRAGDEPDEQLLKFCRDAGIELVIRDCADAFTERVLLPGAQEYISGRTPNPCCECNKVLKFHELFAAADELGISTVVTGHYAKLVTAADGSVRLGSAADFRKDQSYFLYRLGVDDLRRVRFPLGDLCKDEVRSVAAEAGLSCASRPDSQDACFQVAGECCGDTLCRLCGLGVRRGKFIFQGKTVGYHQGIQRYTIGQRQGLGVALGVPAYIKSIDSRTGNIELCTDQDELLCREFTISRAVWQTADKTAPAGKLSVRIRYRSKAVDCTCIPGSNGSATVIPDEPQRAVTPGQSAVFYADGLLACGGIIDRTQICSTSFCISENCASMDLTSAS